MAVELLRTSGPSTDELFELIVGAASILGVDPVELVDLADFIAANLDAPKKSRHIVEFIEEDYYSIMDSQPIRLEPFQKVILELFFPRNPDGSPNIEAGYANYIYSTVKKSGKTALAGAVMRWVAEEWGPFQELLCAANDMEQARGRVYQSVVQSIELSPGYDDTKNTLYDGTGRPIWRIIERNLLHFPSGSVVRALSNDYAGEAGSNPTGSSWSELWAYTKDKSKLLWEELTPPPTRRGAFRWVETYAGFRNQKGILWDLYIRCRIEGRQLTCHDVPAWPFISTECNCTTAGCREHLRHNAGLGPSRERPDSMEGMPLFIHEPSRTIAYWDQGVRARRMPWQTPSYYIGQAADTTLTSAGFDRLHNNYWTEGVDAFTQIAWWDANKDDYLAKCMLESPETLGIIPWQPADLPAGEVAKLIETDTPIPGGGGQHVSHESVILSADAAVSSDCCALGAFTRHPDPKRRSMTAIRAIDIWYPPAGGKFNYQETIERKIRWYLGCDAPLEEDGSGFHEHSNCKHGKRFNVVVLAYDEYQLHDMMQRLAREGLVWTHQFGQGIDRTAADFALYTAIRDRRLPHPGQLNDGLVGLRDHIMNADKKTPKEEDNKLRIVKRENGGKIDGAVVTSMGNFECTRLNVA